jgi:hypothetical protein
MNKLRMLVLTVLGAATGGIGALDAVPSASAAAPKQPQAAKKVAVASTAERPQICFYLGPWKYCI